jgi:hypothetical protein
VNTDAAQALWNQHAAWSRTAGRLKKSIVRWRSVVLILTVGAAALQTVAATIPAVAAGDALALTLSGVSTVALAVAPFLTLHFLRPEATGKWLRTRSVSEGIKSEVYSYLAQSDPYVGPDGLTHLIEKVKKIQSWATDLDFEVARTGKVQKPLPAISTADDYLKQRVLQQLEEYYLPQAKTNADRAHYFQMAAIALAGIAAVLSALATSKMLPQIPTLAAWVSVATTFASALLAHASASRYDFQASTFYATARQLKDLEIAWRAAPSAVPSPTWSALVKACEEAISAENRGWMAKLDESARNQGKP